MKAHFRCKRKRYEKLDTMNHFCDLHGHTKVKCVFIVFALRTVAAFSTVVIALLRGGERDTGAVAEGGAVMVQHAFLAHQP